MCTLFGTFERQRERLLGIADRLAVGLGEETHRADVLITRRLAVSGDHAIEHLAGRRRLGCVMGCCLIVGLVRFCHGLGLDSFGFAGSPRWQPAVVAKARRIAAITPPRNGNVFVRVAISRIIGFFSQISRPRT